MWSLSSQDVRYRDSLPMSCGDCFRHTSEDCVGDTIEAMLHATEKTLAKYSAFIESIRTIDGINERRPGVFYRKSKAFLHFHEDPTGLYADLRTDVNEGFVRIRVESGAEQSAILREIVTALTPPVHE